MNHNFGIFEVSLSTMKWAALTLVGLIALGGCHVRLQYPSESPSPKQHRLERNFWFWGLVGDWQIEADHYCAQGRLYESHFFTSLGQGVLTFATLGIYSPRTVILTCSGEQEPLPEVDRPIDPLPEFLSPDPSTRPFEQH